MQYTKKVTEYEEGSSNDPAPRMVEIITAYRAFELPSRGLSPLCVYPYFHLRPPDVLHEAVDFYDPTPQYTDSNYIDEEAEEDRDGEDAASGDEEPSKVAEKDATTSTDASSSKNGKKAGADDKEDDLDIGAGSWYLL